MQADGQVEVRCCDWTAQLEAIAPTALALTLQAFAGPPSMMQACISFGCSSIFSLMSSPLHPACDH